MAFCWLLVPSRLGVKPLRPGCIHTSLRLHLQLCLLPSCKPEVFVWLQTQSKPSLSAAVQSAAASLRAPPPLTGLNTQTKTERMCNLEHSNLVEDGEKQFWALQALLHINSYRGDE